jgi:hypothetical protein
MDTLLSKLTNLAYELFGVILPGIFALVSIGLLWAALGPVIEIWSVARVPALSGSLLGRIDTLEGSARVAAASCLVVSLYILGHALNWISRGIPDQSGKTDSRLRRTFLLLRLRFPKPQASFDASLTRLFDAAAAKLSPDGVPLSWREFYPVAKALISQHVKYSLVTTYQNKYTLHRTLAAVSVALFWASLLSLIGGVVTRAIVGAHMTPNWLLLAVLLLASLGSVAGFYSSYLYTWRLFGDSIVTESYFLLYGPKLPSVQEEKT